MAEKRSSSGATRKIRALLSSFIRHGGAEEKTSVSGSASVYPKTVSVPVAAKDSNKGSDGVVVNPTPTRRSFRPLSSEDFFHRLESFTAFTWFAKPSHLSPLKCARYGWENIESDSLKCVSCKELLFAGLPPQWETKQYEQACNKLEESLVAAHAKICPWPASPSPESFLQIPLSDSKEVVETYCKRVSSMNKLGTSLPNLDLCSVTNETCDPDTVSSRLHGLFKDSSGQDTGEDVDEEVWKISCLLALLGWQKSSSDDVRCPVLVCKFCRRHAGLWNFLSLEETPADSTTSTEESDEVDTSDSGEPQAKRIKQDSSKAKFNPITEHRSWCPWVQPSANHSSEFPKGPITEQDNSNEPITPTKDRSADLGWQQLMVVLLRKSDPDRQHGLQSTTPPSQAWKTVRKLLSFWQSKDVEPAEEADEGEDSFVVI